MMAAHFGTSSDGTAKTPAAGGSVFSGSVLRTAGTADSGQASVSVQSVSPNSPATDTKLDWKAQKEEQARLRKRQNDLKRWRPRSTTWRPGTERSTHSSATKASSQTWQGSWSLIKKKEDLAAKLEVLYEKMGRAGGITPALFLPVRCSSIIPAPSALRPDGYKIRLRRSPYSPPWPDRSCRHGKYRGGMYS